MNISDAGLDLIKSFEGYHDKLPDGSCRAYLDKLAKPHVWTIGWGCTDGVRQGMIWTREQAEEALLGEIATFERAVNKLVTVDLNQNEFDALVSFAYNVGAGALGSSTLLKKLNDGDRRGAANEFKRWKYAGGKVWPGLVDRRAREATLFLTPPETPAEPSMPQVVEAGPPQPGWKAKAFGWLTAGAGAGQVIAEGPPEAVTNTVTQLTAWQALVTTLRSVAMFGFEHWPWVAGFMLTVCGLTWWSRRTQQ